MEEEKKPTIQEKFVNRAKEIGCKNEPLLNNFFMAIDTAIKNAEEDRLTKPDKQHDPKIRWASINIDETIQSSIAYANIHIDAMAEDMISFIFYKNKKGGYDITFVEGVSCMEILARRYGVNCPENVKAELVYSTDVFKIVKKDINNPKDDCIHEITSPFDRGVILGGYTISQFKNERFDQLREMSLKDINKRTKEYTPFFKKWPAEMCIKTLKKNAWSKVVLNTVDLAEYYASKKDPEFIPDNKEDLPFLPKDEI